VVNCSRENDIHNRVVAQTKPRKKQRNKIPEQNTNNQNEPTLLLLLLLTLGLFSLGMFTYCRRSSLKITKTKDGV
jgi:hypothetical protein